MTLKCILFDLDNTLYPKSAGLFELVVERIRGYMETQMGFEKSLAQALRHEYIRKYGSTMRGLMVHHNLNPDHFLEYVHDVGVEQRLSPNPALNAFLESISLDKCIFTSGHRPYALKVLRCLGVDQHFPRIFDITFTNFIPKPNPEAYNQVLQSMRVEGRDCMMVEDLPANLKPAKELGMTTVLVGSGAEMIGMNGFVDHTIENVLELRTVLQKTKT